MKNEPVSEPHASTWQGGSMVPCIHGGSSCEWMPDDAAEIVRLRAEVAALTAERATLIEWRGRVDGEIPRLRDEVAALTAENARLRTAAQILTKFAVDPRLVRTARRPPDLTDDELAFLRAVTEQPE